MEYYRPLDVFRSIAVILVLVSHLTNNTIQDWALGRIGVDLFFVLSGFLITNILIKYKEFYTTIDSLKLFYVRRAFRILPIYYLYLAFITAIHYKLMGMPNVLRGVFFCVNFDTTGSFRYIGHFWSLCVEEQFYLFWPLIILTVPYKFLSQTIISIIVASILWSVFAQYFHIIEKDNNIMHSFSCAQALAMGGLVALNKFEPVAKKTTILLPIAFLFWLFAYTQSPFGEDYYYVILRPANAIISTIAIIYLINAKEEKLPRIFGNKYLIYLGKISYGVYVYHIFFKYWLDPRLEMVLHRYFDLGYYNFLVKFPINVSLTIIVASLSYRYFEKPILKLRPKEPILANI